MNKQELSDLLRKLHLAKIADTIRFYLLYLKNFRQNARFKKDYPGFKLPPRYLMYESFKLDNYRYLIGGKEDAQWIVDLVKPFTNLESSNILDWGCGPGRIIRHLPSILGASCRYYGTDYNPVTIKWCKKNIPGINFSLNKVSPPLEFPDNYFNLIYGISILTHLSEENQSLWSRELHRIINPAGVVMLTTHGAAFIEKLTDDEANIFMKNKLVLRTNVIEGHRMYGAFHPPQYIRDVFVTAGFKILEHQAGKKESESYISQDVWLLKKVKSKK